MRVAFDHQVFSWQTHGGISRYFVRLAQELLAQNQSVRIFSPLYVNNYLEELPNSSVFGYKLRCYPPKLSQLFIHTSRIISQVAINIWEPQVIHETYYTKYPSGSSQCPRVITVYDMIHELFPSQFSQNDKTSQLKMISVNRADHIICISKNTRDDLIRLFNIPPEKITVIHLGFERFSDIPRPRRVLLKSRPYLLYVGSRYGYKNFHNFLSAFASSSKLRADFDLITFGGGKYTSSEKHLIKKLGFFSGQIKQVSGSDEVLGSLYENASAFVYPSMYEGFGLPPLEAMAHGCPVISSHASSMPEVIGNAAEFFDPYLINDISRAIESVVYDDERIKILLELGFNRLREFSWSKCATKTIEVYEMFQQ